MVVRQRVKADLRLHNWVRLFKRHSHRVGAEGTEGDCGGLSTSCIRAAEMLWIFVRIIACSVGARILRPSVISGKLRVWSEICAGGKVDGSCKSL